MASDDTSGVRIFPPAIFLIALAANALWPLVFVVLSIVVVQRAVIVPEEAYLERKFGAPYVEYKRRVRRWI